MKTSIKIIVLLILFVNGVYSQCDSYGSISVTTSGYEAGVGYTQEYVLVNGTTGVIFEINNTGSFNSLESGEYYIYAVNYEGSRPPVLIVGGLWSNVNLYDANATNCFDALNPYSGGSITVCNQGCITDPLTVASSGYYTGGSSTQTYVLVLSPAASNNIITSNLTGDFTSSDYTTDGVYELYAVNTEYLGVISAISAGSSWTSALASINANCADFIGPLYYEISTANCVTPLSSVSLILEGKNNTSSNNLVWSYNDVEIEYFDVYKSDGKSPYQKIARTINPYYEDLNVGEQDYYKVELISKINNKGIYSNSILLEREFEEDMLTLYPNPTNSEITISFYSDMGVADIYILNNVGQLVQFQSYEVENDISHVKLNVSDLSKGVYYIQLKTEKGLLTKKIIKY